MLRRKPPKIHNTSDDEEERAGRALSSEDSDSGGSWLEGSESESESDSGTDAYVPTDIGKKRKKKTKKNSQHDSQHNSLLGQNDSLRDYALKFKTAMKTIDDNIEKSSKLDSASETDNASETDKVMDTINSDHDYSTKKKYAIDAPRIFQIMVENNTGKDQSHNKRQYCAYCSGSNFSNFAQHLINCHSGQYGEEEVNAFMTFPKRSKERSARITEIRLRGNHMMNMATLQAEQGMFVVNRRPSPHLDWKVSDYSPCPSCKVWVLRTLLAKHQKNCVVRNNQEKFDKLSYISEHELGLEADLVAGRISLEASDELQTEVFTTMRSDYIGTVAKKDPLICCLGNIAMKRNISNKATRANNVSSAMRLAARWLIELRTFQDTEEKQKKLNCYSALVPEQYENIVSAVFAVCREACEDSVEDEQLDPDEGGLGAPSNAIKLSYDIGRLCAAKTTKAIAISQKNNPQGEIDRVNAKRLMQLYKLNWQVDVLKRARHCLREKKLNVSIELPDPKDIAKFAAFMLKLLKEAKEPQNYDEFKLLQIYVLARLIQFNRRRPGEMQVLKYVCYTSYSN